MGLDIPESLWGWTSPSRSLWDVPPVGTVAVGCAHLHFLHCPRGIQGGIGDPALPLPCPQQHQQQGLSQPGNFWVSLVLISTSSCCARCSRGCSWHRPGSPGASWSQSRAGTQKHSGGGQGGTSSSRQGRGEGWSQGPRQAAGAPHADPSQRSPAPSLTSPTLLLQGGKGQCWHISSGKEPVMHPWSTRRARLCV